ncbi:MAG: ATP-binding protein [Spirochaetaceae bacterium]|jgi:hypothetical protein|nr:ATP-binding protein [Spirochaetaceae bacterium]
METRNKRRLPKLPAGKQVFEAIRREGYLYVDKTQYLVDLIDNGSIYFLARPRRFGKSLTVFTLEAMFSGKKELFDGTVGEGRLAAAEWMERPDYEPCPVIHLDMSRIETAYGEEAMIQSMQQIMYTEAKVRGVKLEKGLTPAAAFESLIFELFQKTGKRIVLLIDEYDKAHLDFFANPEKAERARELLRNIYGQIKPNEQYLRFIFVTGISKFTKMGMFSSMNNLTDISRMEVYSAIVGFTENEVKKYFAAYLKDAAKVYGTTMKDMTDRIRDYYDGFSFDGKTYLYNPYSMALFFMNPPYPFFNYWIDSGSTKALTEYIRGKRVIIEELRGIPVDLNSLMAPSYEIDKVPPEYFFYQTGYLSLRKMKGVDGYDLDYPNKEVLNALSALLVESFTAEHDIFNLDKRFKYAFESGDMEGVVESFNALLRSIPYDDYTQAAQQSFRLRCFKFTPQEGLYRSILLSFLRGTGTLAFGELHNSNGREDLVVAATGKTLVIELKVAYEGEDPKAKLAEALAQFQSRDYGAEYPDAFRLALVVEDSERQITQWQDAES